MTYYKENWERKTPLVLLSHEALHQILNPIFPNKQLDYYTPIQTGLANSNFRLKFLDYQDEFILRIYTKNNMLDKEMMLTTRFSPEIPMPEFIHTGTDANGYRFAIQKWIPGYPLHHFFQASSSQDIKNIAAKVAEMLCVISNHSFSTPGFFGKDFNIQPFESENQQHPFIAYIDDCLKDHAKKWLGESLADSVWQFVLKNQAIFPSLEPACLVHGDFNPDNILINAEGNAVAGIIDWEFSFAGTYLFDIGNLLRIDIPPKFEQGFIEHYEVSRKITLPEQWKKMIKLQDLSNLIGLLNTPHPCPNRIKDITLIIQEILRSDD
jgi:aminoglycoside phosphotransferase (APT) family kinase protein